MKYRILLLSVMVTGLLVNCAKTDIFEVQKPERLSNIITLTAGCDISQTRVALTDNQETQKVEIRWNTNDQIFLYALQGQTITELPTATIKNIRNDGKLADFDVDLSNITGTFDLIGSMVPLQVDANGDLIIKSQTSFIPLSNLNVPRYFKKDGMDAENPQSGNVSFTEQGSLLLLPVFNNTQTDMKGYFYANTGVELNWMENHYALVSGLTPGTLPSPTVSEPDYTIPVGKTLWTALWFRPSSATATDIRVGFKRKNDNQSFAVSSGKGRSVNAPFIAGKAYRIPLAVWDDTKLEWFTRPKLAIEYVAEYNVNIDGTGFANSHNNNESGYFSWYLANGQYYYTNPTRKNLFNEPAFSGYHLPTLNEWRGIFPSEGWHVSMSTNQYANVPETAAIHGVTADYLADYNNFSNYQSPGEEVTYAIRMKGNGDVQKVACRYKFIGSFSVENNTSHLRLTVRYLGPASTLTIADISNEAWWNANNGGDIVRIFPAAGYEIYGKPGMSGNYWSATEYIADDSFSGANAHYLRIRTDGARVSTNSDVLFGKSVGLSVRPFSDN